MTHPRRLVPFALVILMAGPSAGAGQSVPRLSLGPVEATAEIPFTAITSVRELSDGRVLVGDAGEIRLVVVDWRGPEVEVLGRVGDGPLEYRAVGRLCALRGDSTLFVDGYSGRWLLVVGSELQGALTQGSLRGLPVSHLLGVDSLGDVLVQRDAGYTTGSRRLSGADSLILELAVRGSNERLSVAAVEGAATDLRVQRGGGGGPNLLLDGTPLSSTGLGLLTPDGWVAVAHPDPYRVEWRAPDGSWIRGRALVPSLARVTREERCFALARWLGNKPCNPDVVGGWPEVVPAFLPKRGPGSPPTLLAAADGTLLVWRTPTVSEPHPRYDLVDRRGVLVGTLTLSDNERLVGFGPGHVYSVASDAFDLQSLRRHRWPLAER